MSLIRTASLAFSLLAAGASWAQSASAPTDPQIGAIVTTAHELDIDSGKLAKKRANSEEVKKFAQYMIDDHTRQNKEAMDLTKKLKVKPEPNDTSKQLKSEGKDQMDKLKNLKGAEFDRAYIDHEVMFHQKVIDTIDSQLIPNAKNAELKALLEKSRPAINSHLEHAKQLQASLGKSGK